MMMLLTSVLYSSLLVVKVEAAQSRTKDIINIVVSESDPSYIDKILYEAFSKLGHKLNITCLDVTSAVVGSNSGQYDGLGIYIAGLEKEYVNLVKVPESIADVEFCIFSKAGRNLDIKSWDDMSELRVACDSQNGYLENILQDKVHSVVKGFRASELFDQLANDACDVVIALKVVNQGMIIPEGIEHIASMDKQPVYPYVHKSYEYLVEDLSLALRDMKDTGLIEKLQKQERIIIENPEAQKSFLYMSSNSEDSSWNEELLSELKTILSENDKNEIYALSLNSNKYPSDFSNSKIVMNMIRSHYVSANLDAVIVSDYVALEFVKENYFSFFKGIPVIFCGINDYSPEMIKGYEEYFTGVAETLSVAETTEQLLKMFPNTKNIFVINDFSADGRIWKKDIQSQLSNFEDRVNVIYNPNAPMSELLSMIQNQTQNTLIFTGMFFLDSEGVYFSERLSEKSFCQSSNMPIYSIISSRIGNGEVGGKCINALYQGRVAGEMALKLASGVDISEVPVILDTEKENKWIFDYNIIKKYNLTNFDFPENTIFLNKPLSFRESNPEVFYLVLSASIVILGLLGVLLSIHRRLVIKNKSLILSQASLHSAEELLEKEILLRESNELMEKVIQTAPLAYIFSVDGIVINSNIYAQDHLDIYPGDSTEIIYSDLKDRKRILEMLEVNSFISGEIVKYKTKDFTVNRYHTNISKSEYQGSTAYIAWGINIEASEYQKDSLAKAHKDMQKVLNALPIPLVIMNPSDFRLVYANNSFLSLFGQEQADDFSKIDIFSFLPEKQPDGESSVQLLTNIMDETIKSPIPTINEVQHILENGEIIDIKTVCETLLYKGTNSIIVLMQDISAEKKQADMLKNTAEKEKEANQLKNRFIINMSHEIRTPMNAIIGLSEIELTKSHSKDINNTFKKINSSAKNLLTIVNDILDFSKIEAEKLHLAEEVFDLQEVISNAMIVTSQRLEDKFVEMHIDIDCDLPEKLIGDKTRLWQVLRNLLDNATKYTIEGDIVLTATALNKNAIDNIFVKFQIKDTGLGIKESNMEKLFTPFEQFHQYEVNVHGTGLGMTITKQITELMGGIISVESEYGVGTTVTVIIPFKQTSPVLSIRNNCAKDELNDKSILVVDDNPLIIDMLTSFLSKIGLTAVCATTAEEAYEKAAIYENNDTPFDIILLDYILENGTCLELAKKVTSNLNKNTKLVLLTAYSKRLMPEEIKEHGFVEVIEKPFIPSMFLEKLCLALNIKVKPEISNKRISFTGARVLLCEDNMINQEVAQGMLSLCNITPIIVENGQEALELLQREDFHLILMDILMPVMDGHEATVRIRGSDAPYANIPIVAMTANAMRDEVDKCKAEGMNGHIAKPIDFDKLYEQLMKWLPKECRTEVDDMDNEPEPQETQLEGVDMAQGIARFGGNRERYIRALYKYAETFKGIEQPFEEIISDKNIDDTKKQIHTIKGVSGNLGITLIYKAAVAFEESLISKEPSKLLYKELQNICIRMNKKIVETFSPDNLERVTLQAGTSADQNELLSKLRNSLQSFDPESSEKYLTDLKSKKWQDIDERLIMSLCNEAENYRFESALEFLDRIQGSTRQQNN